MVVNVVIRLTGLGESLPGQDLSNVPHTTKHPAITNN